MKLINMKKGNPYDCVWLWNGDSQHIQATFDIVTDEGITIKGFKLIKEVPLPPIDDIKIFVEVPSKQTEDGKSYDIVQFDSNQYIELTKLAKGCYEDVKEYELKTAFDDGSRDWDAFDDYDGDGSDFAEWKEANGFDKG